MLYPLPPSGRYRDGVNLTSAADQSHDIDVDEAPFLETFQDEKRLLLRSRKAVGKKDVPYGIAKVWSQGTQVLERAVEPLAKCPWKLRQQIFP